MIERRYELVVAPIVRSQLAETLPESVAFAAYEFITGPLLDNPHRLASVCGHHSRIATVPVEVLIA